VYDEHVDVQDPRAALDAALRALDPARDLLLVDQVPTDTLDHAAPVQDLGSHIGIDCTAPLEGEPPRAPLALGPAPALAPSGVAAWSRPHPRLLVVSIKKDRSGQAHVTMEKLWRAGETAVIVVVDHDVDVADPSDVLFHATANLDPARDVMRMGQHVGVDATVKRVDEGARAWPPIIQMDDATRRLVDKRWSEYGV
jgi:3-polyprenyl-4-hydroxybenzoate decarboxylase